MVIFAHVCHAIYCFVQSPYWSCALLDMVVSIPIRREGRAWTPIFNRSWILGTLPLACFITCPLCSNDIDSSAMGLKVERLLKQVITVLYSLYWVFWGKFTKKKSKKERLWSLMYRFLLQLAFKILLLILSNPLHG